MNAPNALAAVKMDPDRLPEYLDVLRRARYTIVSLSMPGDRWKVMHADHGDHLRPSDPLLLVRTASRERAAGWWWAENKIQASLLSTELWKPWWAFTLQPCDPRLLATIRTPHAIEHLVEGVRLDEIRGGTR